MPTVNEYDVIIIGAGPGGYVAGIRAAQQGLRACVIEKNNPGGVCLNWGCIPSKNLIHQAEVLHASRELEEMGIPVDTGRLDFRRVHEKSRAVVSTLVSGVRYLLKKNKVTLIQGEGTVVSDKTVALSDGTKITGKNILIATGSRPMQVPGFEFDGSQVLSSTDLLSLQALPKSLIILGGGAIGCEFAYVMNAFGVKVHLVEMMDQLLPFEDTETVAVLEKSFKASGVKLFTGFRAVGINKSEQGVVVEVESGDGQHKSLEAEKILCVFGRTPNTDDIGLENIGLKTEKGYIPVDDDCQTGVQGVYAIGDVVASPLLAHVASKEGEIAIAHIAGDHSVTKLDLTAVPSAIYCNPQVASFGLREREARENGIVYKSAMFPFKGAGKTVAIGKTEGMLKTLYDPKTEEILGAHIVGGGATELIHEILLAKTNELLPQNIAEMIHAHPTFSEAIMEMMRAVNGTPIHI